MIQSRLLLKIIMVPLLVLIGCWLFLKPQATMLSEREGLSKASTWVLDNGATVYYLPEPSLPMVDVEISIDAGSVHDGVHPGLALLTNALLKQGTHMHDTNAFIEALEDSGGQLGVSIQQDFAILHLRTLSDQGPRQKTVALLSEALAQPLFKEVDLVRMKNQLSVAFSQEQENPGKIGKKALIRSIFADQSYGSWPDATSIQAISLEDIEAFYHQFYNTQRMVIAIVGDLTRKEAHALAIEVTKEMPSLTQASASIEIKRLEPQVQHITFPSQQAYVTLGMQGVPIGHPDYPALCVGHHILVGSGMSSLLFESVRNQKGLSYDMRGSLMAFKTTGLLTFETHSRAAVAKTALETIQSVIQSFSEKGPTAEQLQMAKENLSGGFSLQFMDNKSISKSLAYLGFYGLPLDYYDHLLSDFSKVTSDAVQKAWETHFSPEKLSIVVVGP